MEYKHLFENRNATNYDENGEHNLYKIMIYNNTEVISGMIYNSRSRCEFCETVHSDNCEFQFPTNCKTLRDVIRKADRRNFILVVEWKSSPPANLDIIENPVVKSVCEDGTFSVKTSNESRITLYDCLNSFMQEETLSGDDKWYCNKCKDFVIATKKMEVYKTPEILIIHFKRFSHNRTSMFGSRKISEEIDFPIEGLNMSNYVLQG